MNDKREGTEAAPDSVRRILADLEIIERRLDGLLAARGASEANGGGKARELLRSAIRALAATAPAEASEEAGTAKRRVKIKAESEITAPSDGERAGTAAKSGASPRSTSRGSRSTAGRRSANADKTPPGLLARLGAAAEIPPVAQAQSEPPAGPAGPVGSEDPLKATADRLAQLEAEIADLTEAVTASPARAPATTPTTLRSVEPEAREETQPAGAPAGDRDRQPAEEAGDGEHAEITIIGADGAPVAPTRRAAREAQRIFRDGPMPEEEEAEVDIKGDGTASPHRRGTDRVGIGRDNTRRSDIVGSRGSLGKWRIFRNSN